MLKNFPLENFTPYRNQTINLQCTSVDWFPPDLSLHHKELLNSPEYKYPILYITHKYDYMSIHFTQTRLLSRKNV